MRRHLTALAAALLLAAAALIPDAPVRAQENDPGIQLGPRPFYLVDRLDDGELKDALAQCEAGPFYRTDFSIGHRGAALQFPEHTRESYTAAARTGAGVLECDVAFTQDRELVCRHAQCDLHTTTDILAREDLAAKCSVPFSPADPESGRQAQAQCCTSDITLEEFKTLNAKMDAFNPDATTVEEYMNATAGWRTDLYATRGTPMTHKESIELLRELGTKFTPELKSPEVEMPFEGEYTQADYAQQLVDEYREAGIDPGDVWLQSFDLEDVRYWIENEPEFGEQAVYLDGRYDDEGFDHTDPGTWSPNMEELAAEGVRIIAPPMWMLVRAEGGEIVPSVYAEAAREAGLDMITWTLERSPPLQDASDWYYRTLDGAVDGEGDVLRLLDVLAQDVGVIGVFSDWPATTTFYASCMGLE